MNTKWECLHETGLLTLLWLLLLIGSWGSSTTGWGSGTSSWGGGSNVGDESTDILSLECLSEETWPVSLNSVSTSLDHLGELGLLYLSKEE